MEITPISTSVAALSDLMIWSYGTCMNFKKSMVYNIFQNILFQFITMVNLEPLFVSLDGVCGLSKLKSTSYIKWWYKKFWYYRMVIGKTSPYFHFPIIFPWKWPDPSFEKKIIIQEALEPSFVDTRGGVLEKIQIWNKLICTWKD